MLAQVAEGGMCEETGRSRRDFVGTAVAPVPGLAAAGDARAAEMRAAIGSRVGMLRRSGVRQVVLLNHHGGAGQFQAVEEAAREQSDTATRVHGLKTYDFNDLGGSEGWSPIGGHAGYAETT
jgi:creatinine amidohydrolase/Fe(II)-dependent formamide hydrolase-like protein